jgi:hypothetical protein
MAESRSSALCEKFVRDSICVSATGQSFYEFDTENVHQNFSVSSNCKSYCSITKLDLLKAILELFSCVPMCSITHSQFLLQFHVKETYQILEIFDFLPHSSVLKPVYLRLYTVFDCPSIP